MSKSDTPRTDNEMSDGWSGDAFAVSVEFSRQLERELAAKEAEDTCDACAGTGKPVSGLPCMCGGTGKMSVAAIHLRRQLVDKEAELARLTDIIEEQKRTIQSLMMGVEEHTGKEGTTAVLAYIGGVEAELAESRAQVARLLVVITNAVGNAPLSDNELIGEDFPGVSKQAYKMLRDTRASLHDQSARDARVLKAAEKEYKEHNYARANVTKTCGCQFCQAVRGDKNNNL